MQSAAFVLLFLCLGLQVKGWLCCKLEALQRGLQQSALGQAFRDMDHVQLAAYCFAMLAEYVQEPWLAVLRDIYSVPTSGAVAVIIMLLALEVSAPC